MGDLELLNVADGIFIDFPIQQSLGLSGAIDENFVNLWNGLTVKIGEEKACPNAQLYNCLSEDEVNSENEMPMLIDDEDESPVGQGSSENCQRSVAPRSPAHPHLTVTSHQHGVFAKFGSIPRAPVLYVHFMPREPATISRSRSKSYDRKSTGNDGLVDVLGSVICQKSWQNTSNWNTFFELSVNRLRLRTKESADKCHFVGNCRCGGRYLIGPQFN